MKIGPVEITIRKKALPQLSSVESRGGWWPIIRESWAGAWQSNVEITLTNVLSHPTVFACIDLISSDIPKMQMRLVREQQQDIWVPTENPAFSPVLRKPNHYQTPFQFFKVWLISKLAHGNTYVLKARDNRNVVQAMYVLDPQRVRPLVAPDGAVYYEIKRDDLSQQPDEQLIIPAREVIHDICVPLFHPLVGVSPLYASGLAATLALRILTNSTNFFTNGSMPGGIITAPGSISQTTADRIKAYWETNYSGDNFGKIAVLGDSLKFEQPAFVNAQHSQLIEQWDKMSEAIASTFHVPYHLVGGPPPPYNNIQALTVQYYTQCIQAHAKQVEDALDKGLGLDRPLGTEFDIHDLLWMDTATMMETIAKGIGAGVLAPNDGRRMVNLPPVEGGDTPYLQNQNFSLEALNAREELQPAAPPKAPARIENPQPTREEDDAEMQTARFAAALLTKMADLDYAA